MERSWLPAVIIGGGASVLVGAFVLLGGGSSSNAADAGPAATPTTASVDAPPILFDATLPPAAMDAAPSPPPAVDDTGSSAPQAIEQGPIEGSPAAKIKARMAQLETEIAALESEGKHEEAAQKKSLLLRMKAKADMVKNGL